jgi:hypothetical protein
MGTLQSLDRTIGFKDPIERFSYGYKKHLEN